MHVRTGRRQRGVAVPNGRSRPELVVTIPMTPLPASPRPVIVGDSWTEEAHTAPSTSATREKRRIRPSLWWAA
jgi:hypothetical protein